jgi:hypothetical protein
LFVSGDLRAAFHGVNGLCKLVHGEIDMRADLGRSRRVVEDVKSSLQQIKSITQQTLLVGRMAIHVICPQSLVTPF